MTGWTEYPFASVADERHPLLRFAVADQRQARATKIEWLLDSVNGKREIWTNWTQIVRTPFRPRDDTDRDKWLALERHLRDVENILWYGTPSYDLSRQMPLSTCGGVLHYLGRQPLQADAIVLRPLRDLGYREYDSEFGHLTGEFLSEISLEVRPAPEIKPYREPAPRPMPQGSSLAEAMAA